MSDYRRAYVAGAMYFFTIVTHQRRPWLETDIGRASFRLALRATRRHKPFETIGIVLLPDHVHAIWSLPDGDSDYSMRWKSIKQRTTNTMCRSLGTRERLWQPRFWEHLIRDDEDLRRHLDYIHYNPVKHGLCDSPHEWSASSFRRYVDRGGVYSADWGGPEVEIDVPE